MGWHGAARLAPTHERPADGFRNGRSRAGAVSARERRVDRHGEAFTAVITADEPVRHARIQEEGDHGSTLARTVLCCINCLDGGSRSVSPDGIELVKLRGGRSPAREQV